MKQIHLWDVKISAEDNDIDNEFIVRTDTHDIQKALSKAKRLGPIAKRQGYTHKAEVRVESIKWAGTVDL